MQRHSSENSFRNLSHSSGMRAGFHSVPNDSGVDSTGGDSLYHTVFDDVPLELNADDLKEYEKLLHNDLWFDGHGVASSDLDKNNSTVGIPFVKISSVRKKTDVQIEIESEAFLAELKRRALEDGGASDFEETRKLDISFYKKPISAVYDTAANEPSVMSWRHLLDESQRLMTNGIRTIDPWFSVFKKGHCRPRITWNLLKQYVQRMQSHGNRFDRQSEYGADTAEFQIVRTSPLVPSLQVRQRQRYANLGKVIVGIAAFLVAVGMMFNTPTPGREYQAPASTINFAKGVSTPLSERPGSASRANAVTGDSQKEKEMTTAESSQSKDKQETGKALVRYPASRRKSQSATESGVATSSITVVENSGSATGAAVQSAVAKSVQRPDSLSASASKSAGNANPGMANAAFETPAVDADGQRRGGRRSVVPDEGAEPAQDVTPFVPPRATVKSVMDGVAPMVAKCRTSQAGELIVKVSISGATGKVVSARVVDETFRGTPTAICVASVVNKVRFPVFQKDTLLIRYPYKL